MLERLAPGIEHVSGERSYPRSSDADGRLRTIIEQAGDAAASVRREVSAIEQVIIEVRHAGQANDAKRWQAARTELEQRLAEAASAGSMR